MTTTPGTTSNLPPLRTLTETAAELRCSTRKVAETARVHGIGYNLGGRAGWRFTPDHIAELLALHQVKPEPELNQRRRRRRREQRASPQPVRNGSATPPNPANASQRTPTE